MIRSSRVVPVLTGLAVLAGCGGDPGGSAEFRALLDESELQLSVAPRLEAASPFEHEHVAVEHALRHRDVPLEIRYAIRPIQRLQIEFDDPHSAAPRPNDLYPMLFETLIRRVGSASSARRENLAESQAQEEFGADWAAIAVLDVNEGFGGSFKRCMLLALHRDDVADAYAFFLFNDQEEVMPAIRESLHALRFVASPPDAMEPAASAESR